MFDCTDPMLLRGDKGCPSVKTENRDLMRGTGCLGGITVKPKALLRFAVRSKD